MLLQKRSHSIVYLKFTIVTLQKILWLIYKCTWKQIWVQRQKIFEPIVKHCVVYLMNLTAFLSTSKLLTWDTRITYYKVLTFSCTNFKILNTVLHTTDLMMHDFELHEFFYSPKNVHLKALMYYKNAARCILKF